MSDIGLILNVLLGGLLVIALALGWRLERRLKALRDSHDSFAAAVGDLDRAAARAEQGLSDLRAATDEAAETLAIRIERAKALASNLEKLTADAGKAEERLSAMPRPAAAATRESVLARFAERYAAATAKEPSPAAPVAAAPSQFRTDLILDDEPPRPSVVTRLGLGRDRAAPASARVVELEPSVRSRARIDDDLFDEPAPRRAGLGGLSR